MTSRSEEVTNRQRWERQRAKLKAFLAKLETMPTMHGQKWRDKMLAHYTRQLEVLDQQEPPPE